MTFTSLLTVTVFLLASGCQRLTGGPGDEPVSERTLAALRAAPPPTLYYLGSSFAGLPLTHAEWNRDGALFVYGRCGWKSYGDYGTCTRPQIQVQQFAFDPESWRAAAGCRRLEPLRGVPTLWHGGLTLVAGGTVIKISGRHVRRAARTLHAANARVSAAAALPRPEQEALALLARACGARPDERGPRTGDPSVRVQSIPGSGERPRPRVSVGD